MTEPTPHRIRPRRWAWGVLGVLLTASPLLLYTRPGFLVMLADTLWSCF